MIEFRHPQRAAGYSIDDDSETQTNYPIFNLIDRASKQVDLPRSMILKIFENIHAHKRKRIFKNPEGFAKVFLAEIRNADGELKFWFDKPKKLMKSTLFDFIMKNEKLSVLPNTLNLSALISTS